METQEDLQEKPAADNNTDSLPDSKEKKTEKPTDSLPSSEKKKTEKPAHSLPNSKGQKTEKPADSLPNSKDPKTKTPADSLLNSKDQKSRGKGRGTIAVEDSPDQAKDEEVLVPAVAPPQPLSKGAVDKRLRRIVAPRVDGSYIVPDEIVQKFRDRSTRKEVELLFEKSGYHPESWQILNFAIHFPI